MPRRRPTACSGVVKRGRRNVVSAGMDCRDVRTVNTMTAAPEEMARPLPVAASQRGDDEEIQPIIYRYPMVMLNIEAPSGWQHFNWRNRLEQASDRTAW